MIQFEKTCVTIDKVRKSDRVDLNDICLNVEGLFFLEIRNSLMFAYANGMVRGTCDIPIYLEFMRQLGAYLLKVIV